MKTMTKVLLAIIIFASLTAILSAKDSDVRIDVIYFHATVRCQGCLTIEDFAKKSIDWNFKKELEKGKLTFTSIDFLQDSNAHYQDDYKFDSQTLVLSKKVVGKEVKYKILDKIWDYSGDYEKFQKYVKDEIIKFQKD